MDHMSSEKRRRYGHAIGLLLTVGIVFCIPHVYKHYFQAIHLPRIRQSVSQNHAVYDYGHYESASVEASEEYLFVVVESAGERKTRETYYARNCMIVAINYEESQAVQTQRWNAANAGQGLSFKLAFLLLAAVMVKKMIRNARSGDWRGLTGGAWTYWEKWLSIYGGVAFVASMVFMVAGLW